MGETPGDVELSSIKHDPSQKAEHEQQRRHRRGRRRCLACCCGCGALLIIIALIVVFLALTVFKPKKPKLHVDRVTVEDLDSNIVLNIPPSVSLNITLGLAVSVTNPNKVAFKFNNSTAFIFYRNVEVGSVPIPAGYLGAGGTTQISSSLKLLADRLLTDTRVYTDVIAGSLPISTTAHVGGRVNFLNIFKRHVDTTTVCKVNISPFNAKQAFENLDCTYGVHL